jgi:alpha-N-arabinofuranosidase
MVLTPTYHVFRMYKVHQGATRMPVELSAPKYILGESSIPALSASASRDSAGRLHLSIVNLDPNRPAEVTATVAGPPPGNVSGEVLTASAMNAMNTFDRPHAVEPAAFTGFKLAGSQLTLNLPAKSVVVLELE